MHSYIAHVIVLGPDIGQRIEGTTGYWESECWQPSLVCICRKCGEVWLRARVWEVVGEELKQEIWIPIEGLCGECGDGSVLQWGVMHHRRDQGLWALDKLLIEREIKIELTKGPIEHG